MATSLYWKRTRALFSLTVHGVIASHTHTVGHTSLSMPAGHNFHSDVCWECIYLEDVYTINWLSVMCGTCTHIRTFVGP